MTPDQTMPQPRTPNFDEVIQLGKPLTIEEAIEKMMSFHKTSREIVLSNFFNLNKFAQSGSEGTVVFEKGANPESLLMRFTRNGQEEGNDLVNQFTGRPMSRIG